MYLNKGFTLIEVLVAFVILAISISIAMTAYKEYNIVARKQKRTEDLFIAAISLMNKLKGMSVDSRMNEQKGEINGFSYKIKVEKVAMKRNYIYSFDKKGNKGDFLIILYKITLLLGNKKFVLYKTQYRRLY